MKLNYRDPIWALAVIASLILFAYQCESAKSAKLEAIAAKSMVEQKDAEVRARIEQKDSAIQRTRTERVQDSLKFASIVRGQELKIKALLRRRDQIRPEVDAQTDSLPVVRRLISIQDSVILSQGEIIATQHEEISAQSQSYLQEIAMLGTKNVQAMELVDIWKNHAAETENKLKKEQRRKRFWKGLAIGAGTAAVVLGLAAQ